ncbi:MAG TPA: MarR family transcriptional regulator [Bacillota bacterium]|nr:MarR family transcriptional regulator [Bacillota bacterium]
MHKEDGIISLVAGFMKAKRSRMEKLLAGQGIHSGQAPMLFAIFRENGLSQKKLGEKMHLRPASVTIMLKRLMRAGLVDKNPDAKDLRVFRVFLTEKGESIKDAVNHAMETVEAEALKGLTQEEIESFRRTISRMKANLDNPEPKS